LKFIIGLGNPGLEYDHTKHNMGFEVVKALAKEDGIKISRKLHFSLIGKGVIAGQEVSLVLPQTFMNLSGKAVGELFSHEVKEITDILVVCDDINIDLGRIRLKKQGSAGGHKGLESIIHTLHRDDFARLKIGIATEVHKGDITRYVLSPFKRHEKRNAGHAIDLAADTIRCMLKEGMDTAMNKFNKRKAGTS
jgi:peptidyl-tRNA hydrolase, PTH1 family